MFKKFKFIREKLFKKMFKMLFRKSKKGGKKIFNEDGDNLLFVGRDLKYRRRFINSLWIGKFLALKGGF